MSREDEFNYKSKKTEIRQTGNSPGSILDSLAMDRTCPRCKDGCTPLCGCLCHRWKARLEDQRVKAEARREERKNWIYDWIYDYGNSSTPEGATYKRISEDRGD